MGCRGFAKPAPAKGPSAASTPVEDDTPKIDPSLFLPEEAFPLGPLRNGLTKQDA
jgi:hypothetical protein